MKAFPARLLLLQAAAVLLAMVSALRAQTSSAPARLALPDTLATTVTGRTIAGKSWVYAVWQPSDPGWMKSRKLAVYLKSGGLTAAGTFARVATAGPVTDVPTLSVILERARTLGDNETELTAITTELYKRWGNTSSAGQTTTASRLALLVNRAASHEDDASTLRQISIAHPAVRMALGLAWGGTISNAPGTPVTLELREVDAAGNDLAVVGRAEFTAGQPPALTAPGAPVHVVDLSPEGNLNIKLRWGVPDALRRQALQTIGFGVYRVPVSATLPSPLTTVAQLSGVAGFKRVVTDPVILTKLFTSGTPANATDAANLTADPSTFFIGDDNDRDTFAELPPISPGGPPRYLKTGISFTEGDTFRYYTAALDWLGQPGPLSPAGTGVACLTIPPPVPAKVRAEEILTAPGQASTLRFRITFPPNATATGITGTQQYHVYRGAGTDPQSLQKLDQLLPDPQLPLPLLAPGVPALPNPVTHAAVSSLSYDDTSLTSSPGVENQTYWYAVRAVHQTPCGPVYSAPSPPAFATFHDRTAPAAPVGDALADIAEPVIIDTPVQFVARGDSPQYGKGRAVRLRCSRLDPGIRTVQFFIYVPGSGGTVVTNSLPFDMGPGVDTAEWDFFWPDPIAAREFATVLGQYPSLGFAAVTLSDEGAASFLSWQEFTFQEVGAGTTTRMNVNFTSATRNLTQMHTGQTSSVARLESLVYSSVTVTAEGISTAQLTQVTHNGKTVIVSGTQGGITRRTLAKVVNNRVVFKAPFSGTVSYVLHALRTLQTGLPPALNVFSPWPPPRPTGLHNIAPANSVDVPAVVVSCPFTPDTREFRIYRRIDQGPLTLLAQGAGTWTEGGVNQTILEDKPNLPAAGRICYFGQLLDQHGNASALAQLGPCIDLKAPLPVPLLQTPVATGSSAAPVMRLTWFCPRPGVRRHTIRVFDTTDNSASDVSVFSGTVKKTLNSSAILYLASGGTGKPPSFNFGATGLFVTNPSLAPIGQENPADDTAPVTTIELNVTLDHEYLISVRADGDGGTAGPWSTEEKFVWRAPVASGAVAWPARPLPKVIQGSAYGITAHNYTEADQAAEGPVRIYSPEEYPVLIPIAIYPLQDQDNIRDGALNTEWYVLRPDTGSVLYRGLDPNASTGIVAGSGKGAVAVPMTPFVVYRQLVSAKNGTVNTTDTGTLVQVSPMIRSITWKQTTLGGAAAAAIVDPYLVVRTIYNGTRYTGAYIEVADQHPVLPQATYRYFLVRFADDGEIDQVIDAGSVTTPAN